MFSSYMTFYTKYFVLSYSIDVGQLYLIYIMCINELVGEYVWLWIVAANAIVGILDAHILNLTLI